MGEGMTGNLQDHGFACHLSAPPSVDALLIETPSVSLFYVEYEK